MREIVQEKGGVEGPRRAGKMLQEPGRVVWADSASRKPHRPGAWVIESESERGREKWGRERQNPSHSKLSHSPTHQGGWVGGGRKSLRESALARQAKATHGA